MKYHLIITSLLCWLNGLAQIDQPVTVSAALHLNSFVKGIGTNDAGAGLDFSISIFTPHRLHALIDASAARFIGDKRYIVDGTTGEEAVNARLYNLHAGPELFVTKRLALSISYGCSWHKIRAFDYSTDRGLKYGLTTWLGKQRSIVGKIFLVSINAPNRRMQYLATGLGYRF